MLWWKHVIVETCYGGFDLMVGGHLMDSPSTKVILFLVSSVPPAAFRSCKDPNDISRAIFPCARKKNKHHHGQHHHGQHHGLDLHI